MDILKTKTKGKIVGESSQAVSAKSAASNAVIEYKVISSDELSTIITSTDSLSYLLVDCGDPSNYTKTRIKYSVNVPLENINASSTERFTSQRDVANFFYNHCPNIIGFINAPGFYTNIVVFNESSTSENFPNSIETLLEAIAKWNKNTLTKICFLQGGSQNVSADHKIKIPRAAVAWSFPVNLQISDQVESYYGKTVHTDGKFGKENGFTVHLENLSCAIRNTWSLVLCKRQLKSLEALKRVLNQENISQLHLSVPEDLKCPVCLEMFTEEIFQCANGDCFCANCSSTVDACPFCGTLLNKEASDMVRNKALERVLMTAFKVGCPFTDCTKKLAYHQVTEHIVSCTKKPKESFGVISNLEKDIESIENVMKALNQELECITKSIVETELLWNTTKTNCIPNVSAQSLDDLRCKTEQLGCAKMSLILETFCSKTPITKKNNLFW